MERLTARREPDVKKKPEQLSPVFGFYADLIQTVCHFSAELTLLMQPVGALT